MSQIQPWAEGASDTRPEFMRRAARPARPMMATNSGSDGSRSGSARGGSASASAGIGPATGSLRQRTRSPLGWAAVDHDALGHHLFHDCASSDCRPETIGRTGGSLSDRNDGPRTLRRPSLNLRRSSRNSKINGWRQSLNEPWLPELPPDLR